MRGIVAAYKGPHLLDTNDVSMPSVNGADTGFAGGAGASVRRVAADEIFVHVVSLVRPGDKEFTASTPGFVLIRLDVVDVLVGVKRELAVVVAAVGAAALVATPGLDFNVDTAPATSITHTDIAGEALVAAGVGGSGVELGHEVAVGHLIDLGLEVAELGVNALRSDGDFVAIIDLQSGADLRDGAGAVRIFESESGHIRCDEYRERAENGDFHHGD